MKAQSQHTRLPERRQTDERLNAERERTDRIVGAVHSHVVNDADLHLERARVDVDADLRSARETAADRLAGASTSEQRKVLADLRAAEDGALEKERAAADDILRGELADEAAKLAALLPLEREHTDRALFTERARSDDAIAHRDDFLGMVTHDLRNLLGALALTTTAVAEGSSDSIEGRRTREEMKRIQRYIARMNRLIGDLVDVVSIDAGRLSVRREPCDVAALVHEVIDVFAATAAGKGLTLAAEVAQGLAESLDRERMLQVLLNLVSNAIKFTPPGGHIEVRAERADGALRISVSDDGIGIPAHLLDAVFERFWQGDQGAQRGLGLGLYIARQIVGAHGGIIGAESVLGKGTTFRIAIPTSTA